MTSLSQANLRSPEEIAMRAGQQVPFLRLPARATLFAEREMRLRQKAVGHPIGEFLDFLAEVAHCQHAALQRYLAVALPDGDLLDAAARRGVPPLPAATWPRDGAWRDCLHEIVEALLPRIDGVLAHARVSALREMDTRWLERQAQCLLDGEIAGLEPSTAPLVAAALQTHWTHLVLSVQEARDRHAGAAPFGRIDDVAACPCCGSRPTASVVQIGPEGGGHRYLHCSLCSSQWHMVRIKCSHCLTTKGLQYFSLQAGGDAEAVQAAIEAETCGGCGRYLKIVHRARDPEADPVADDVASLMLDLLVEDAGFERHGANPMLVFGTPEPSDDGEEPAHAAH